MDKLSELPANLEKLINVKLEITSTRGENENVYINRRIVLEDGGDEYDARRRATPSPRSDVNRVTVVVDTREQEPYTFESACTEVVRRALPADYSVEGHEDSVAVERKTLEDFVSTVIRSRKRFTRELRRVFASTTPRASWWKRTSGTFWRPLPLGAHPNAVLGASAFHRRRFRHPGVFLFDRQAACRFVEEFLHRYHRKVSRRCEQDQTTNP